MASVVTGRKRPFETLMVGGAGERTRHRRRNNSLQKTPGPVDEGMQAWMPITADISRTSSIDDSPPCAVPRSAVVSSTHSEDTLQTARFRADASIVLMGIRGAGKSTLAVIASSAMSRTVVDSEKSFFETTGLSSPVYKKTHGLAAYYSRQAEVLQTIFRCHASNTIIVCSWTERNIQGQLRDFGRSHPIIHIVRDADAIREHLKMRDHEKMREILDASGSIFRAYTDLEFFNVTEHTSNLHHRRLLPVDIDAAPNRGGPTPYLTLKRTERHFLKFLSLIFPKGTIPFIESAFPLASLATEERQFTYAVTIPLSDFSTGNVDIEDIETGADAIEIVVDDLVLMEAPPGRDAAFISPRRSSEISRVVSCVRRNTVIPILYHVVLPEAAIEDDEWRPLYLAYLLHGLRLAPEYISVDLGLDDAEILRIRAMKGSSKLLAHLDLPALSAPPWTDAFWMAAYHRAHSLGANLVRMRRVGKHFTDNLDVSHLYGNVEKSQDALPVIAYNTGQEGRHSACFNRVLTSVLPAGRDGQGGETNLATTWPEPCLTALQATRALYSSFVYDAMKLYVFGANVGYSLSPAMHNAALAACGIPHHYRPHSTTSIRGIQELVNDDRFAGASIGLPFKVEIISLTHSLSRHAKAVGAVNTLIPVRRLNSDGSIPDDALLFNYRNRAGPVKALYGENTDWIGIRACIRRGLSPANAVRSSSAGLVIGAGGMARAAVYSMLQLGVKNIAVFNRTLANAENLIGHFKGLLSRDDLPLLSKRSAAETQFHLIESREEPWPENFRFPTMIVSCIPTHRIGDSPAPDFTLPPQWLGSPTGGVVVELAYKTLNTPLLEQARKEAHRGWVTMDGLDLLPEQGFAQFELFTGRRAPRRLMRREVFRSYPDGHGRSNVEQLQPRLDNIGEQEP